MMLEQSVPAVLAALLVGASPPSSPRPDTASLIVNGSFEKGLVTRAFTNLAGGSTALAGWVVMGEGVDLVGRGYWKSSDSTYAVDLDGSARSAKTPPFVQGGIAQTFATAVGKRYVVTFDLAGNPMRGPTIKPIRVSAAGQSVEFRFDITGKSARSMGWVPKTWTFTAKRDSTTLEFRSLTVSPLTGFGAAIDNVAVRPIDDPQLEVTEDEKEVQVRLGAEILFDTGEYTLRPEATAALEKLSTLIKSYPELPILIEGHTDSVGTPASNQTLSRNRADAVKRWLTDKGAVPASRITTKGYGFTVPVAPNSTPDGRQKNRRVEVRLRKR